MTTNRIHVAGQATLIGNLELMEASRKPLRRTDPSLIYTVLDLTDEDAVLVFEELEAGRPLYYSPA